MRYTFENLAHADFIDDMTYGLGAYGKLASRI